MPKEFAFYFDSKCIKFIKYKVTHQKLRAWENLTDFRKKGKTFPKRQVIISKGLLTRHP